MYHHLRGKLVETGAMLAVVEAGGVGYEVRVPLSTLEAIRGREEVLLYTYLLVREDDLRLFGFASRGERYLFELILSVSGVGPSLALSALSSHSAGELAAALATGDTTAIRRIKGIGKRLAERLVVELRDRVEAGGVAEEATADVPRVASSLRGTAQDPALVDAVSALVALGFSRKDAERRVTESHRRLSGDRGDGDGATVARLIRESLR